MPNAILRFLFAALLLAASVSLLAQQPQVSHAQFSTEPAGDLPQTLHRLAQSPGPLWVGYVFPTEQPFTANNGRDGVLHLERENTYSSYGSGERSQSSHQALLLLRFHQGALTQTRLAEATDRIDADGLRFVLLTGVSPEASIVALREIALTAPEGKLRKEAVFFLSLHRSPAAVPALAAVAASGQRSELREDAAFWLANGRGHDGFLAVQQLAHNDPDAAFRKKLTFDLTLSHDPGALPELIRMAHEDAAPEVRAQAQFWMAQQAGKQAGKGDDAAIVAELRRDADSDSDAHARKQAVFALSRLPAREATPQLEALARTGKDPEVRKQAVFWLGQSQDPAALQLLTQLLEQPANQAR